MNVECSGGVVRVVGEGWGGGVAHLVVSLDYVLESSPSEKDRVEASVVSLVQTLV